MRRHLIQPWNTIITTRLAKLEKDNLHYWQEYREKHAPSYNIEGSINPHVSGDEIWQFLPNFKIYIYSFYLIILIWETYPAQIFT